MFSTFSSSLVKFFKKNELDSWRSFLVAVCSCLMQALIFGVSNSFSIFSYPMSFDQSLGNPSLNSIAVTGSICGGVAPLLAVLSGKLTTMIGSRATCYICVISMVISLTVTSAFAKSAPAIVGIYGVFMAIAIAFMITPGATATATWFNKYKSFGMGICFSGGGLGSLIIPPIAGYLSAKYSWRICFNYLALFTIPAAVVATFVCLRPTGESEAETEMASKSSNKEENEVKSNLGIIEPAVTDGERGEEEEVKRRTGVPSIITPDNSIDTTDGNVITATKDENRAEGDINNLSQSSFSDKTELKTVHNHKCTFKELFKMAILTRTFQVLFWGYAMFSFGFYGFLYIAIPYVLTMGREGTLYSGADVIPIDKATTLFYPFGAFTVVSSALLGYVANRTKDRYVCSFSLFLAAVVSFLAILVRSYLAFVFVFIGIGIGFAGFFATYTTMVSKRFYGPNLGFIIGLEYAADSIGGFLGPYGTTAIVSSFSNSNHAVALALHGVLYLLPAALIFFLLHDPPAFVPDEAVDKREKEGGEKIKIPEE